MALVVGVRSYCGNLYCDPPAGALGRYILMPPRIPDAFKDHLFPMSMDYAFP